MGKASRRRKSGADRRPVQPLTGGAGALRRPAVRGPARRDRLGGDARDPPGRHGHGALRQGQGSRGCARRGDRGHRAPARVAGPAPRRRHGLRRHPVGLGLAATRPATSPSSLLAAASAEQGTPVTTVAPATADTPRLQDILDTTAALRGDRARGLRLLGRRQRARRRGQGVARAGQRVGHPDRQDGRRAVRLLVPHRRAHPHPPGAARRRGRRHRRPGPPARGRRERPRRGGPGCSAPSARAACSCRSGTSTRRRTPTTTRTPLARVRRRGMPRRSASTEPLTAEERRARSGLLSRQVTLR